MNFDEVDLQLIKFIDFEKIWDDKFLKKDGQLISELLTERTLLKFIETGHEIFTPKKATKTRTAELEYVVVKKNEKYSLLKILPKTGRFHQIRIQMLEMGCPILGDAKYSSQRPLPDNSIGLCATAISFKSATEDKTINLEIPLPEGWNRYI